MKKVKLYIFFILVLLFIPKVYEINGINVAPNENIQLYERNSENKYKVNKKWEITDKNLQNVLRTPSVDASKKIYDFSGVISDA